MFRFFSNIRKKWIINSFRRAYTIAIESRNYQERLSAAKYALEMVNTINSWSIPEVLGKRAVRNLHETLTRTYMNLLPGNRPYYTQLAIKKSHNSLDNLSPEDGIKWSLTINKLSILYAESVIGPREVNLEKAIQEAELTLTPIKSEKNPLLFKAMANLGGYYNERQLEDHTKSIERSIQNFEEILRKLNKYLPPIDIAGILVSIAVSYSKVIGHGRRQKIELAIDGDQLSNSAFTFALLMAIQQKQADLNYDVECRFSELQQYLSRKVGILTNGRQLPTFHYENILYPLIPNL